MKKKMMDILVCPVDHHILEIFELNSKEGLIIEGVLYCAGCSRFYPILEEIPVLLPDELRDKKQDLEFLENNKKNLPEKIVNNALPWHL